MRQLFFRYGRETPIKMSEASLSEGSKKDNRYSPFSTDREGTGLQEMPTVSSLLKRKKAGALQEPESIKLVEVQPPPSTEQAPATGITLTSTLAVYPSKRGKRSEAQLIVWTQKELTQSGDPLANLVLSALKSGVSHGLFLSIMVSSSKAPTFVATAYFGGADMTGVWNGLKWDPRITPQIWKKLIQDGFIDLPPPSADTNVTSERNLARNAVGASSKAHALIVRVGPATQCRGLLVLLSGSSMAKWADENSKLAFTPVAKPEKAAA